MTIRLGSLPAYAALKLGTTDFTSARLGTTLVWNKTNVRDDFNRANSTGLGASWTDHGPSSSPYLCSVVNNYARLNIPDGLISLDLQLSRYRFNTQVPGDDGYIEARLATKGDAGWDRMTQVFGRLSNAAFTHGVGFQLDGTLRIVRRVANTDTVMADCGTYEAGDVIRLIYAGTEYSMYRNGSFVGGWSDTGASASVGSGFRSLGIVLTGTKDTLGPRRFSAALDYVEAA